MQNILSSVTILVNFTARKAIKSEVSKMRYNRIDSIIDKMDRDEKTGLNLVAESNLTTSRYRYKSQRKTLLEIIQKNLHGIALSSIHAYLCVDVVWRPPTNRTGNVYSPNVRKSPLPNEEDSR